VILMQGKFFGFRKFTPCPACGQERILLDYDDTAIVVPVVWEDVDTCDGEVVDRIPSYVHGEEFWRRRSLEGRTCPKCGGPLRIEKQGYDGPTYVVVGRCKKPRTSPQYRRVQGCPQCSKVTTWYGIGLTAEE